MLVEGFSGLADLLDDDVLAACFDDSLNAGIEVVWSDGEVVSPCHDLVVLRRGDIELLEAAFAVAFAVESLKRLDVVHLGAGFDALVDTAHDCLVASGSFGEIQCSTPGDRNFSGNLPTAIDDPLVPAGEAINQMQPTAVWPGRVRGEWHRRAAVPSVVTHNNPDMARADRVDELDIVARTTPVLDRVRDQLAHHEKHVERRLRIDAMKRKIPRQRAARRPDRIWPSCEDDRVAVVNPLHERSTGCRCQPVRRRASAEASAADLASFDGPHERSVARALRVG